MVHRAYYSYLNDYLRQCLGAQELLLPNLDSAVNENLESLEDSKSEANEAPSFQSEVEGEAAMKTEYRALSMFQWRWESTGELLLNNIKQELQAPGHEHAPIQAPSQELLQRENPANRVSDFESQPYAVLFVRKPLSFSSGEMRGETTETSALEYSPQALELFHKLRQAMNLNATVAPYVELEKGDFDTALHSLRSQAHKIIIMCDDCLQKGDSKNDWVIPDPTVLEQHPHLKRPTWELLKRWLAEV